MLYIGMQNKRKQTLLSVPKEKIEWAELSFPVHNPKMFMAVLLIIAKNWEQL